SRMPRTPPSWSSLWRSRRTIRPIVRSRRPMRSATRAAVPARGAGETPSLAHRSCRRSPPAGTGALVRQKPALALDPTAVARQAAVGADDAMARYDDDDRVRAVGETDRADGVGASDGRCELPVARRRACRNASQRGPHETLEVRAPGADRERIDRLEVAGEEGVERRPERARGGARP